MLEAMRNAFRLPDLRRRLLFTLGVLIIYRLVAHIPVPGVDAEALRKLFESSQLLGLLDMFSGGAMSSFSVIAMGVYPYITASIVMQLLVPIIPRLENMIKEGGEEGRRKIEQYTHWLTVPLAALQGFGQATLLARQKVLANFGFSGATILPSIATILTLTAGTIFAVWLGELIDEKGIGNGISIIIFSGIVARVPQRVGRILVSSPKDLIIFTLITIITVAAIVYVQEAHRRIPVQYGRRVRALRGNRLMVIGGQSTHIPMRVNSAGMIPLIFAQSLLLLPATAASYMVYAPNKWVATVAASFNQAFDPRGNLYWIMYFFLVVGFTYFYTDIIFKQQNLAEVLQKQGGFIPGIRPGKKTEEYLNKVLQRITLVGAIFLGLVAVLPWMVRGVTETQVMILTSAGLLIVVGVVLDTMKQLEAQLIMRHYEGFLRR
ncbi:MAG: preprotein translocase subunit SecY [Chloroflexi bacterium]|nr:MAG: preprotein translocase subunit SecY [Chloroflexota bacterium]HDN79349.1 preprotein translocase subunit SecY [Chloroflexota bacterium]